MKTPALFLIIFMVVISITTKVSYAQVTKQTKTEKVKIAVKENPQQAKEIRAEAKKHPQAAKKVAKDLLLIKPKINPEIRNKLRLSLINLNLIFDR